MHTYHECMIKESIQTITYSERSRKQQECRYSSVKKNNTTMVIVRYYHHWGKLGDGYTENFWTIFLTSVGLK